MATTAVPRDVSTAPERRQTGPAAHRQLVVGAMIGLVAFVVPLIANLRGGGPIGVGMYDDGVYFSAATGLVHGRVPYRDFLLLHPPGIVAALAPFAWLGNLTSDSVGFLAARLAWLAIGALSAILVWRILRPLNPFAAVFAGLFYAVFYPAIYVTHTILIEAPQNLVLLLAIWIISRQPRRHRTKSWRPATPWVLAGLAVGLSPCFKIWGVIPVVLVLTCAI
jgi:alpha-1,2-mannosyltransferase